MSIVLSHTTAKAVYQAAHSVSAKGIESCNPAAIYGSCPTGTLLDAAAEWLTKHDVSLDANDSLEVMVFDRRNARYAVNCQCHVSSKRFSNSRFIELKDGIFVVGVELCALQAATYLSFRELVEYYFELCGAYSLGTDSSTSYTERFALTSTERLKQFFNSITRCDGLALARKAIQCVRDGCRSPMETAFVMMLTLPKSEGGLGIKGIETDYEVQVTTAAKNLTRRKKFFMDAYLKKSRTDIEYNGFYHDAEEDRAIDEERKNALASMGYGIITVSRYSFMHASSFVRVMEAIQRKEGVRPSRLPKDFQIMQEDLRQFVLRRFIEEKKRIQKELRQDSEERQRIDLEKQCSKASHWTIRRLTRLRQSMTCRLSNPTAHHSTKQAASRPRAGSSGPEARPANKVGTLAMCKIASIQQGRPSSTHKLIQMRNKDAIERER